MKNFLKHILVPILVQPPISRFGAKLFGNTIPVFMLHRIQTGNHPYTGTTTEYLRRCLQYLVDNEYNFVSLEDIILASNGKKLLPANSVAFTMDDGYWDQAEIAAPIFIEFNCPATIFVITGMLDGLLWPWDAKIAHLIDQSKESTLKLTLSEKTYNLSIKSAKEKNTAREIIRNRIKELDGTDTDLYVNQVSIAANVDINIPAPNFRPMTWDNARQLEDKGIKFAPHSVTHRMLSKLDDESSENEIIKSWQRLKEELSAPSPVFCYPTGRKCDYGNREVKFLIKNGLAGAVSTIPGHIATHKLNTDYKYNIPRFALPANFEDFIQYCSWIENMKNKFRPSY